VASTSRARPSSFSRRLQYERDAVVGGKVACRDVLAIAAEIGESERAFVEDAHKPRRPAAVLQIWPSRLADGGHVEAIACDDEIRLATPESIRR
jgi:hypothetical protein